MGYTSAAAVSVSSGRGHLMSELISYLKLETQNSGKILFLGLRRKVFLWEIFPDKWGD